MDKRETIHIDREILKVIIYDDTYEMKKRGLMKNGIREYQVIEEKITGADAEDGGADRIVIIKRLSDKRFFKLEYTDWDMQYNFERDFPEDLTEVFPEQVTTTVYK